MLMGRQFAAGFGRRDVPGPKRLAHPAMIFSGAGVDAENSRAGIRAQQGCPVSG